ncbi:uncharacterized protein BJ212DRAFT_1487054 [Suillus subaureus]|uniref:Uncharacterized protein n=1 Tax=Suillus subaureus TaxID=48587 RepID=A0A9P7DUN2_9AGAM|nr:uncharacterized protein BJ212DRAFT_1487054 [Suillus subaureus]KAG1803343.1 hypothetical protein BJ212DRAFT_1487054 [Suillus subaureus]
MIEDVEAENLYTPDVDFGHEDVAPCHVRAHSGPEMDTNPTLNKIHCVSVKEVDDEDGGQYIEPQPNAGWGLGEGETRFERRRREQQQGGEDLWSPFEDAEEWGLVQWVVKNLGQTQTDEFLKLPITQQRTKLSFHNNCSFLQRVDKLPHGPGWSCQKVTVHGNHQDEDGELLQEEADMAYSPGRAYADHAGQHRVIDKMWTADWWGEKQKALPEGATIALIILSSDKMTLSQF